MGSPVRDYYVILEIDRNADLEAIKKAYRKLVCSLQNNPNTSKTILKLIFAIMCWNVNNMIW